METNLNHNEQEVIRSDSSDLSSSQRSIVTNLNSNTSEGKIKSPNKKQFKKKQKRKEKRQIFALERQKN